eukprot:5680317-Pleurochrysis_carterae.AAC.5
MLCAPAAARRRYEGRARACGRMQVWANVLEYASMRAFADVQHYQRRVRACGACASVWGVCERMACVRRRASMKSHPRSPPRAEARSSTCMDKAATARREGQPSAAPIAGLLEQGVSHEEAARLPPRHRQTVGELLRRRLSAAGADPAAQTHRRPSRAETKQNGMQKQLLTKRAAARRHKAAQNCRLRSDRAYTGTEAPSCAMDAGCHARASSV